MLTPEDVTQAVSDAKAGTEFALIRCREEGPEVDLILSHNSPAQRVLILDQNWLRANVPGERLAVYAQPGLWQRLLLLARQKREAL